MTLAATPSLPPQAPARTYPGVTFAVAHVRACLNTMLAEDSRERTARGDHGGAVAVATCYGCLLARLSPLPASRASADELLGIVRNVMGQRVDVLTHQGDEAGINAVIAFLNNVLSAIELNASLVQRGLPHCLVPEADEKKV